MAGSQTVQTFPALRNNDVVITSKRRHFDVVTSKWRRFDVITTLLLRHVFSETTHEMALTLTAVTSVTRMAINMNQSVNMALEVGVLTKSFDFLLIALKLTSEANRFYD